MNQVLKRFQSLTLVLLMTLSLLPYIAVPAYAATSGTVTGLADENIGLSSLERTVGEFRRTYCGLGESYE